MKLNEFVDQWLGKELDFDGYYGGQCVDLFRKYLQDVLNVGQPQGVQGAVDFWDRYDTDPVLNTSFNRITNTPTGVPVAGDVVIWGKDLGKYGHIAVFLSGDTNTFVSFDENFPVGSKCAKVKHTYKNVLGWLHPKVASGSISDAEKLKKIDEIIHS